MHEAGASLAARDAGALVQLAGWAGFEAAVVAALAPLGFDGAGTVGRAERAGGRLLYRVAPDRVWLRVEGGADGAATALAPVGVDLVVLDLSGSRRCLTLRHADLPEVAPLVLPGDLRPRRWPVGAVVQTGLHGVAVLAHRTGPETLDILVPATWADSVEAYLRVALVDHLPA